LLSRRRHRPVLTPKRHETLVHVTREFGNRLSTFYQTTAINAILTLLAVLLGFGLASVWQAREDQLKDLRNQLAVLIPLSEEATNLRHRAAELGPAEKCAITGFDTAFWASIETTERAQFLAKPVYDAVRGNYARLRRAEAATLQLSQRGCRQLLERARLAFGSQARILENEILRVTAEQQDLNESRRLGLLAFVRSEASGLLAFIGTTLGWLIGILLVVPATVYGLLLLAARVFRPASHH
jgi:hypothetical protein